MHVGKKGYEFFIVLFLESMRITTEGAWHFFPGVLLGDILKEFPVIAIDGMFGLLWDNLQRPKQDLMEVSNEW
ncbi:hypothetical protein CCP3SC1_320009 [Gammaproteobacteria bacterium]